MKSLGSIFAILALLTACGTSVDDDPPDTSPATASPAPVRIVAVGDIACPPGEPATKKTCRQAATARLARRLDPDHVIALGDLQYDRGALRAFRRSYDESWGRLKRITKPVPGNHEYRTAGAAGYHGYWATQAPAWDAWDAGTWRIYNLDSNCGYVDCAAERAWLKADLADHARACTLIAMHHPRYSSGEHGSTRTMARFWRIAFDHRVDVALAGHDHTYQRFAPMDADGDVRPKRGIQSFVSGTGGKSLYAKEHNLRGSRYFTSRRFGLLLLRLSPGEWTWRYRTVDGVVRDSGSRSCV